MMITFVFCLSILLMQNVFVTQADEICQYYVNQSSIATTTCNDRCCSGVAMSARAACCTSISWSSLAIPIFIVSGVCLLVICLMYFRPLLKMCLCGHKCPCRNRSRVGTPGSQSIHDNPTYVMNNGDLPDYETVIKDARPKDMTPPPYTFVTTHPGDFGIEGRVPSAPPPQYRSRNNSVTVYAPTTVVS